MQVNHQPNGDRELKLSFTFSRDDLHLEYSLIGVVVHLADCPAIGEPGSPALPQCIVRIALPPQTQLTDLRAEANEIVQIGDESLPIAPRQPLRPGIIGSAGRQDAPPYHRPDEEQRNYNRRIREPDREESPTIEPYPVPPFVPANPQLYDEATRRPTASVVAITVEGLTPVATINLNPVRIAPNGSLEFSSRIDLTVRLDRAEEDTKQPPTHMKAVSRAQAMREIALTGISVVNRGRVIDYSDLYPVFHQGTDYLIITDNQRWNAKGMAPAGAAGGDLVASFERLAAWKRQRGLKARVVTITRIMNGRYGNFRRGNRDLQEAIRRFLQMAQRDWGVTWVLLGGDVEIIPIRYAATDIWGEVNRQTTNPPPKNSSYWTGDHLRIHAVELGTLWEATTTNVLVRQDNGLLIPYDWAGTSDSTTRGWYFTTDETYNTFSVKATDFVRVNGPASEVNADLRFLYDHNLIPTDLYYSSLVGPQYNLPGKHDWDLMGNGVYGQYAGTNLDGISYKPTVSLGRASVRTSAQADVFVDKVIAYEKYEAPDGTRPDDDWTKRVVIASENWGGRVRVRSTIGNPPHDNSYHHVAGAGHTLIKLKAVPDWNWSLLAQLSDTDVRLLHYRTDADTAGRGWYFARSATDLSPNIHYITMPTGTKALPFPTKWIAVYGTAQDLEPREYIFNQNGLDHSLGDQEELRMQLAREMPGFRDVTRLYEDIEDMTSAQIGTVPLERLSITSVRNALNAGPHIVSLSGHGNNVGCCKLGHTLADSLSNGHHTFIAYADSCLTNQLDDDALSEHLIANPNGGAVAYIGSTRISWVGHGDDYQRRFFKEWGRLGGNAHLGLLNDTRAGLYGFNDPHDRWTMLTLNLVGDPEMPLWWQGPLKLRIIEVHYFDRLKVRVDPPALADPFIEQPYRKNWGMTYVHLRQGDREQLVLAGTDGQAEFPLADFQPGAATLTVTRPGHVPVVQQIKLGKSKDRRGHKRLVTAVLLLLGSLGLWWAAQEVRRGAAEGE